MGSARRKAELRDSILADLSWVLGQKEDRGESLRNACHLFANHLSQRMTQAELEVWLKSMKKAVEDETEKLRIERAKETQSK